MVCPARLALFASLMFGCSQALAADWPQFRGPAGNGLAADAKVPETWDGDTNVKWKAAIPGGGWSAPIVSGGKVIVTTAVPVSADDEDSECRFEVHCLDLSSGKTLWHRVASQGKPRDS